MKKLALVLLTAVSALPALASHPHDRVCVASAMNGRETVSQFVFQYQNERLYDHGGPNEDTHQININASTSYGDYLDSETVKLSAESQKVPPGSRAPVAVTLRNAKGKLFFAGKLDFAKEKLAGKANRNFFEADEAEKLVDVVVTLHCISQPRLTLDAAQD